MDLKPFSYSGWSYVDVVLDLGVRFVINCPQEDISTPVRLMFHVEEAQWFYEDFAREQNDALPSSTLNTFAKSLWKVFPILKDYCRRDYAAAISQFHEYKKKIPVRGVIILNDKLDKVLMVRAWKRKIWGLPRGKINKEEDDRICAVREVYEETGFDATNYLDGNSFAEHYIDGKNFRFYFASGVPESTIFETQTRKEIEEIKWIPLSEFAARDGHKKFFLIWSFLDNIEKHIKKLNKKSASTLSDQQSNALKNLLGLSNKQQTVQNDDGSAQELLSLLKPQVSEVPDVQTQRANLPPQVPAITSSTSQQPPLVNAEPLATAYIGGINGPPIPSPAVVASLSDREVIRNLVKESTPDSPSGSNASSVSTEIEGAKHILALLKQEIARDQIVSAPSSIMQEAAQAPRPNDAQPKSAPVLPPNSMLEQLVSNMKERSVSKESEAPTAKPKIKPSIFLNVLNTFSTRKAKLMDLLLPAASDNASKDPAKDTRNASSSKSSAAARNPLMDLLGGGEPARNTEPIEDKTVNEHKAREKVAAGNELLALLSGPKPETNGTEKPDNNAETVADNLAAADNLANTQKEAPSKPLLTLLSGEMSSPPQEEQQRDNKEVSESIGTTETEIKDLKSTKAVKSDKAKTAKYEKKATARKERGYLPHPLNVATSLANTPHTELTFEPVPSGEPEAGELTLTERDLYNLSLEGQAQLNKKPKFKQGKAANEKPLNSVTGESKSKTAGPTFCKNRDAKASAAKLGTNLKSSSPKTPRDNEDKHTMNKSEKLRNNPSRKSMQPEATHVLQTLEEPNAICENKGSELMSILRGPNRPEPSRTPEPSAQFDTSAQGILKPSGQNAQQASNSLLNLLRGNETTATVTYDDRKPDAQTSGSAPTPSARTSSAPPTSLLSLLGNIT